MPTHNIYVSYETTHLIENEDCLSRIILQLLGGPFNIIITSASRPRVELRAFMIYFTV